MAPPKLADRDGAAVVTNGATVQQRTTSRLPPNLRFPILLALNLFINSALWTATVNFLGPELGEVTKIEDDGLLVLARFAYRVGALYFTWKANYDCRYSSNILMKLG